METLIFRSRRHEAYSGLSPEASNGRGKRGGGRGDYSNKGHFVPQKMTPWGIGRKGTEPTDSRDASGGYQKRDPSEPFYYRSPRERFPDHSRNSGPNQVIETNSTNRSQTDDGFSPSVSRLLKSAMAENGTAPAMPHIPPSSDPESTKFPSLHVSPIGVISVFLRHEVILEMTVNKNIRVVIANKFAGTVTEKGNACAVMHPSGRVLQDNHRIYANLGKDKVVMAGMHGILYTLSHASHGFLTTSSLEGGGTLELPTRQLAFPVIPPASVEDVTTKLFLTQAHSGPIAMPFAEDIVRKSHFKIQSNGSIVMHLNGVLIRQEPGGVVYINNHPRSIRVTPKKTAFRLRTHCMELDLQGNGKCYLKKGKKAIYANDCGLIVQDGPHRAKMEKNGRIVDTTPNHVPKSASHKSVPPTPNHDTVAVEEE